MFVVDSLPIIVVDSLPIIFNRQQLGLEKYCICIFIHILIQVIYDAHLAQVVCFAFFPSSQVSQYNILRQAVTPSQVFKVNVDR